MNYQLTPDVQPLGDKNYLAFQLQGQTEAENLSLTAGQVDGYGIINFKNIARNQTKSLRLLDAGIKSPVQLRSVYSLTESATTDQITFSIKLNDELLGVQRISSNEMPYQFPEPVILFPNHVIEIRPNIDTQRTLIYWQPVNVVHFHEVQ